MEQRTHPVGMWALLHPFVLRCVLFFIYVEGFEPIGMQMSGGHLLPPVFALVATSIFFPRPRGKKMHIKSLSRSIDTVPTHSGVLFYGFVRGI